MSQTIPKVVSADMLPNLRLFVKFDNGEVRYVKTELLEFVIKQSSLSTENFGGLAQPSMTSYWWGKHTNIVDDGEAINVNGNKLTAEELWTNGTTHF